MEYSNEILKEILVEDRCLREEKGKVTKLVETCRDYVGNENLYQGQDIKRQLGMITLEGHIC